MSRIPVLFFLFISLSIITQAQRVTSVQFAYFVPAIEDTFAKGHMPEMIKAGNYQGYLAEERFVSENPKTAAKLIALVKSLKANGSEDINKCFIPRHVVTLVSGDTVLYRAVVCFECDGVRFTNEKKTTRVKSVAKREADMRSLKKYFADFNFKEEGMNAGGEE